MTIKVGDKMPVGTFKTMTKDGPQNLTTDQLFAGKTVVLFSVPGAFTPTCDARHLPGFVEKAGAIKARGVDTIACMAVNDVFVMNAWGKHANVGDGVLMLADGNAEYARVLGLELNASGFGIDDAIDPAETRFWLANLLASIRPPAPREGKKRSAIDAW